MSARIRNALLATLLCLPAISFAATFNRCEDSAGNITFTSLSCPIGHERSVQDAYNAPPGGGAGMLPPASRDLRYSARTSSKPVTSPDDILVVGEQEDGCGNRLSAEQRRKAIMNGQTPPGMTRRDVESLLGKPDTVANHNGEQRYTYKKKNSRSSSNVTFDEYGCVKGKK